MKKLTIFIYLFFSIFSFAKQVEIDFHFDIDSGIIYYSNADIDSIGNITTLKFNKKDIKIKLKNGIYLFGFYDEKDRYLFKKLYITNDRDFNISFIPKKSINVKGVIKENNLPLKDIKITFSDSMGREYSTTSTINGSYSINLPPENYTLISSQFGYEVTNNNIFNFSKPNTSYNIAINVKKSKGKIKGKILGNNGQIIPFAEILVSNNKQNKIVYSDKNGNFILSLSEGITSIKISKNGYNSRAFIKKFSKKDTVSFQIFTLNKKTYSISGTITDDILPLRNQELYLFSVNGALLDKVVTNENGNFKFLNISREKVYIYIPENEIHEEYKSEIIILEKNKPNNIITIQKK